jgi:hypothetical protein
MRLILATAFGLLLSRVGLAQDADVVQIGDPIATTVQLPTFGISFDAEGVLRVKAFTDPTEALVAQRIAAARLVLAGDLRKASAARKISVVRLLAAMTSLVESGKSPTDVMQKLAGLTRITSAFCYPDRNDIVLVGPAEPWAEDISGRTVGLVSGKPTLLWEDLAEALRVYRSGPLAHGFVGCTINPRAEGLARLVRFQRTIPRSIPQNQQQQVAQHVARGVRKSLGMADVVVFGVAPNTHFAAVMVEADYRMKRIAIGVERPPVRMTTFAAAMTTAHNGTLERWWFTPAYEGVRMSPDGLAMQIVGQGVQLQTEYKHVLSDGTIIDAGRKPSRATRAFATSFTKRYDAIAAASPVYAQLRQLTDWLIIAAFLQKHDWYTKASWDPEVLDERTAGEMKQPRTAPVVVNTFWKKNRMFTPAGGGVTIQADKAISAAAVDKTLTKSRPAIDRDHDATVWWWD